MSVIGRVGCITGELTHWYIIIARVPTCCTCILVFFLAYVSSVFSFLSDVAYPFAVVVISLFIGAIIERCHDHVRGGALCGWNGVSCGPIWRSGLWYG